MLLFYTPGESMSLDPKSKSKPSFARYIPKGAELPTDENLPPGVRGKSLRLDCSGCSRDFQGAECGHDFLSTF